MTWLNLSNASEANVTSRYMSTDQTGMKWTVKLIAEAQRGTLVEQEVITFEGEDLITPATIGLTIAEGKAVLESLQGP
jgi:hypothetical protein